MSSEQTLRMGCIQMKQKNLFLMCGVAGSGKSTWIRNQIAQCKYPCLHISRDEVRLEFLKDEDKNMFAYEDDVFDEFCNRIKNALLDEAGPDVVFADATHLSETARNKVLDRLDLTNVTLHAVVFKLPLDTILAQNENRRNMGRAYVPRSVIRRMFYQFNPPTDHEKYHFDHILTVQAKEG